jgi:predicted MPP superfamily phosphohydrolase
VALGGLSRRRALAAAGGLAATVAYARWIEPRRLVVRRPEIEVSPWPPALDGLRVAVLSDLHTGGPHVDVERVAGIARRLAAEQPDLALLLGDFVDFDVAGGDHVRPRAVVEALGALRPPLGTYAVLGNHDWHSAGSAMPEALAAAGIEVLENRAVPAGDELWLAGVGDVFRSTPAVEPTLAKVPDGAPVLLLSHNPDPFPRVPPWVALTLSGHTHGGQVNLPGLRGALIPSRFGARYDHGLIEEGGRRLLVTGGVGESSWPLRLFRPPEVVVATLRGGNRFGVAPAGAVS